MIYSASVLRNIRLYIRPGFDGGDTLKSLIFLTILLGSGSPLPAQSRYPLIISGGAHSLTVPWYPKPLTTRLNPAFTIGTERMLKQGKSLRYYQTANIGYFRHYWWMTGMFINTELGASRALPYGFHTDLRLGIGYLHYFWRRETLKLENGRYVPATNWGRPSIMIPLSMVFGYRGNPVNPLMVSPFIITQWAIQTPFIEDLPLMTHLLVFAGIRIDLERLMAARN